MSTVKKVKQLRDLDTQRIAEAAIAVIDEFGASGFTMRAVAKKLNVTPMALYHHVKDKAGLAAVVVDAVLREVPLPPTTGQWRNDLLAMANWIRDVIMSHPGIRHLRGEFQLLTPTALQLAERWLDLWQQSGLPFAQAVRAARSSSTAITGFVMEELTLHDVILPDVASLSMLPNARTMLDGLMDQRAAFDLMVNALIDGIHAKLIAE